MKNFIKGRWFPLTVVTLIFSAIVLIMALLGWRVTYAPDLENSWDAISAVAAWISAFAGVAIPIVAVVFQHKLDSNKNDIKGSNLALYNKLEKIEKELEQYRDSKITALPSDAVKTTKDTLKNRIVQYIGVAMGATTKDIANHFGIPTDMTITLLHELRNSRLIGTKYLREDINSEDCHWKRR